MTTAIEVAQWAVNKYGKDAYYMLSETHEGVEVWGEKLNESAMRTLEHFLLKKGKHRSPTIYKINVKWFDGHSMYSVNLIAKTNSKSKMVTLTNIESSETLEIKLSRWKLIRKRKWSYPNEVPK